MPNAGRRAETQALIDQVFAVPYARNSTFTGRIKLLEALNENLFSTSKNEYNHRIALYGPSGIGKTQVALAYAHAYKHLYKSLYWIPAQTQASIVAGYRRIASAEGLRFKEGARPEQIAGAMVTWLGKRKSWLLVFDGLDEANVANNIFPENGTMRHTIITTRNGYTRAYFAQGLEVPVLDGDEAIQLLSGVSGLSLTPASPERNSGDWIVRELGYLPLAIYHAGMYIQQVCGGLEAYIKDLENNRESLFSWRPVDNKQYPYSVKDALARPLLYLEGPKPTQQSQWKNFWKLKQ